MNFLSISSSTPMSAVADWLLGAFLTALLKSQSRADVTIQITVLLYNVGEHAHAICDVTSNDQRSIQTVNFHNGKRTLMSYDSQSPDVRPPNPDNFLLNSEAKYSGSKVTLTAVIAQVHCMSNPTFTCDAQVKGASAASTQKKVIHPHVHQGSPSMSIIQPPGIKSFTEPMVVRLDDTVKLTCSARSKVYHSLVLVRKGEQTTSPGLIKPEVVNTEDDTITCLVFSIPVKSEYNNSQFACFGVSHKRKDEPRGHDTCTHEGPKVDCILSPLVFITRPFDDKNLSIENATADSSSDESFPENMSYTTDTSDEQTTMETYFLDTTTFTADMEAVAEKKFDPSEIGLYTIIPVFAVGLLVLLVVLMMRTPPWLRSQASCNHDGSG